MARLLVRLGRFIYTTTDQSITRTNFGWKGSAKAGKLLDYGWLEDMKLLRLPALPAMGVSNLISVYFLDKHWRHGKILVNLGLAVGPRDCHEENPIVDDVVRQWPAAEYTDNIETGFHIKRVLLPLIHQITRYRWIVVRPTAERSANQTMDDL